MSPFSPWSSFTFTTGQHALCREYLGNYIFLEVQAYTCLCFVKDPEVSGTNCTDTRKQRWLSLGQCTQQVLRTIVRHDTVTGNHLFPKINYKAFHVYSHKKGSLTLFYFGLLSKQVQKCVEQKIASWCFCVWGTWPSLQRCHSPAENISHRQDQVPLRQWSSR